MFTSYSPRKPKTEKRHRLRSLLPFMAFLIIGGLIGGWLVASGWLDNKPAPQKTQSQSSQDESPEEILAYKAEDYLFAIPDQWAVISAPELKQLQASGGIKHKNGTALATMTILSGEQNLSTIEDELKNKFQSLDEFSEISSNTAKVAGHDSIVYTYTYLANAKTSKQTIYATPLNIKVYYLAFTAPENTYADFDAAWERILSTYQISASEG